MTEKEFWKLTHEVFSNPSFFQHTKRGLIGKYEIEFNTLHFTKNIFGICSLAVELREALKLESNDFTSIVLKIKEAKKELKQGYRSYLFALTRDGHKKRAEFALEQYNLLEN